ncbi:MAG: MGMT family protein [Nanoarchaeota archaeon]|nr:MGMT family protein [Nanoarchaeota archaeon]
MKREQVYKIVEQVPEGKVITYKRIAEKLNCKCYQLIGQIMAKNPYAPKVPCHRVVKSNGEVGGFNGKIENKEKIRLLEKEGVKIENGKIIDFKKICF